MNKQQIFDSMIENILNSVTLERQFKNTTLKADGECITVDNEYLVSVPYELEGEKIHGNTRNALAREFVQKYTYEVLKRMYDENIEKINNHLKLEEENKYKLENLYSKINFMEKYQKYNRNGVNYFCGMERYCIEFQCSKNDYNLDSIQIYNSSDYNNFEFRYNYQSVILTENEVMEKIKELSTEYENYYLQKQAEAETKRQEKEKQIQLQNKIFELARIKYSQVIFKNKKTYICYRNGLRFAAGSNKRGKYYNCNAYQLLDLITSKGITEYCIVNNDCNVMDDTFLQGLQYSQLA